MTVNQQRVRLSFNPSDDFEVDQVKGATAALMDSLDHIGAAKPFSSEATRCAKIAQQKYEEACMFAVKALTTGVEA